MVKHRLCDESGKDAMSKGSKGEISINHSPTLINTNYGHKGCTGDRQYNYTKIPVHPCQQSLEMHARHLPRFYFKAQTTKQLFIMIFRWIFRC